MPRAGTGARDIKKWAAPANLPNWLAAYLQKEGEGASVGRCRGEELEQTVWHGAHLQHKAVAVGEQGGRECRLQAGPRSRVRRHHHQPAGHERPEIWRRGAARHLGAARQPIKPLNSVKPFSRRKNYISIVRFAHSLSEYHCEIKTMLEKNISIGLISPDGNGSKIDK